jgi:hypothetical protein
MRRKIFGVLAIILGLPMLGIAVYQTDEYFRIEKYGVQASIDASSVFTPHKKLRGGIEFFATLNFVTQSGSKVIVHRTVSTLIKEKFDADGTLKLKYLAEYPDKINLADGNALEIFVAWGMGLFLLIGGVIMLIRPTANRILSNDLKL